MSEFEPLTREELLEAAELEMLGLLDEVDQARFTRSFDAATPAVQNEVIAAQEALALEPAFKDTEAPSAALRLRTIAGVLDAIEVESKSAAPIATIGPARGGVRVTNTAQSPMTTEAMRELIAELSARTREVKAPRQMLWRAASFLLLAALAVSMYFNDRLAGVSSKLADAAVAEGIEADVLALARSLSDFSFAECKHIDLARVSTSESGHVSVFLDEKRDRMAIVGLGFDAGQVVSVVFRAKDGTALHTTQIRGNSSGFASIADVPTNALANGLIEVHTTNKQGFSHLAYSQGAIASS